MLQGIEMMMGKSKRAALYVRVHQVRDLREIAQRRGWDVGRDLQRRGQQQAATRVDSWGSSESP